MAPPNWGDILVVISLLGAAISWWIQREKDRDLRQEELLWKRTELLFLQSSIFDGDNDISEAVKILTANNLHTSIDQLLDLESDLSPINRGDGRHKLDKLLNFMERIAYARKKDVLSLDEVAYFEWYFLRIPEIESLMDYCMSFYPNIVEAINELKASRS